MKMLTWAGAAALALAVGGTAQAENIKIGVVLAFSGANADLGQQIDKAFDLYCGLVLRHPAGLIQAANFTAAVAF